MERILTGLGLGGAAVAVVVGVLALASSGALGFWYTPALLFAGVLWIAGIVAVLSGVFGWFTPKSQQTSSPIPPNVQVGAGSIVASIAQSGGTTVQNVSQRRTLADTDLTGCEQRLRRYAGTRVSVSNIGGEAQSFAGEIIDLMRRCGWQFHTVILGAEIEAVFPPPPAIHGVELQVPGTTLPTPIAELETCLNELGFQTQRTFNSAEQVPKVMVRGQ